MANLQCTVWILFCGFFSASVQAGVSITGCNGVKDGTRYAEVNLQNEDHSFTCLNIPAQSTILWKLDSYDAGTCPPVTSNGQDSCDTTESNVIAAVIPRRTSPSESVVTLKLSETRALKNAQLQCLEEGSDEGTFSSRDSCTVNLIQPAQGMCKAEFRTSSRPWTVHVWCNITSGSSSLGVYKCRLNQIMEDQSSKELVGWVDMEQNTLPTGSAVCRFNVPFDTLMEGSQHYKVQLQPGLQEVDVTFSGSNIIRTPDRPSKICKPPGLIPEHGNLTCTCSAKNIGQPLGWLRWSQSRDNSGFDSVLVQGERGSEELKIVANLSRQDHNITKFRCDAVWAKTITGRVKVAEVGYPASQMTFSVNPAQPVEEDTKVNFSCAATDGRPAPRLTLKTVDGREMASQESSLTHQSEVRCENIGNYTCTASNGMGPDQTRTAYLHVTCAPRDVQSEAIQPVNYQGEETGFTFELVANPTPDSVSFMFLGSQETNSPSMVKDIAVVGHCRRKTGVLYISSCSIIVNNVTSSVAAGLYRGRIQNQRGFVDFVFEVKVNATIPDTSSGGDTGIVVAVVVGVLVVIAVIVIAIVVYRRRKGQSDKRPVYNAVGYNTEENGRERGNRLPTSHSTHSPPSAEQPLLSDVDERCPVSGDLNDQDVYINVCNADRGIQPAKVSDSAPKGDYAAVQKSRMAESADRMVAGSNSEGPDNLYAVVDKTKKKGHQSPTLSPVPPAIDRKMKDGGKSLQGEDTVEGPVYGNVDVQGEAANRQDADAVAPKDADTGREVNQDGLLYVSVDFSDKPAASYPVPAPRDDGVLYSDVDFSRTAPAR